MLRICGWCKLVIGWNLESKGETHGICESCLQEYFPKEAKFVIHNMKLKQSTRYKSMIGSTAI
jgi:hypothetical protein